MKYEWRHGLGRQPAQLADAVEGEGQRRRQSLENQNGNFPGAAGHPQPRRRLRHCRAITSRTTARRASSGRCRSAAATWGGRMSPALDAIAGGWQLAGINMVTPGETVTFIYTPAAAFQVSGHHATTSRARTTTGRTSTCDPYAGGPQSITQLVQPGVRVVPTDPSQPFGNAPRNSVRGPNFWTVRLRGDQAGARSAPAEGAVARSRRSTCSTA